MGAAATDPVIAIQELRDGFNRLRGTMFSAIEAGDLPTKQENALKSLIRHLTYEAQSNIEAALRGSDE